MSTNIVVFKWEPVFNGIGVKTKLHKAKNPVDYDAEHVNVLYNSVKRNTTVETQFICVTDNPKGINPEIKIVPLWDKCRDLGGCLNRLFVFDESMKNILGSRFMCLDLDAVIVSNIDDILTRSEEFLINKFLSKSEIHNQLYNGGLFVMNAGSRQIVWDAFDKKTSPSIIKTLHKTKQMVGDDQTWIQHILGETEIVFTDQDGIYDYNFLDSEKTLPQNSKIILFPGKVDPKIEKNKINWVEEHWK